TEGTRDEELSRMVESVTDCWFLREASEGSWFFARFRQGRSVSLSLYPEQFARGVTLEILADEPDVRIKCEKAIADVWNCMATEFRWAIQAGACSLYARVGHRAAPEFTPIPPCATAEYGINRWGHPSVGGGEIALADGTLLYDVHICD